MNCTECQNLLFEYIERLVEDRQNTAIETHLRECDACRREEQALRRLQSRLTVHGQILAQTDLETDVLGAIVREQKARLNQTNSKTLKGRKPIMKSPLFKMAIAATVIAACAVGIHLWSGTQSIALADVLTRIQQVRAYIYQMSMATTVTIEDLPTGGMQQEIQGEYLMAPEYGMRMTLSTKTATDPNFPTQSASEQYVLPQQKRMLMLMPDQKKYMEMELNDQLVENYKKQSNDPRMMVEQFLKCDYETLGRSKINGIEAEGFQTSDPAYMGAMGAVDVTLWVDADTWLPIQMDMDMELAGQMHMTGVLTDFQWDVPVDASLFDPVIPEDYTPLMGGPMKMPEMDEATAIKGLKLFAEYGDRYPEELNMLKLMADMGDLMKQKTPGGEALTEAMKKDGVAGMSRKMMDVMLPIQSLAGFYALLVQGQKEPVYYGETVTPETPDAVLLRWKTGKDEYRVIFGDLEAQTVTAAQLAELEGLLPQ